MSKAKIEAVIVNEGEEFDFFEGDQILHSEVFDQGGTQWGLVILRSIKDA